MLYMEILLSKIRTIGLLSASAFLLLISFFGGVYVQHSMPVIENTQLDPDPSIILIKQKGYASILSSFDEALYAVENEKPTDLHINKIRKAYYEIELFLPSEYRSYMQKSIDKAINYLTSVPQQKENYISEKRQLRRNLQNMLELNNI